MILLSVFIFGTDTQGRIKRGTKWAIAPGLPADAEKYSVLLHSIDWILLKMERN